MGPVLAIKYFRYTYRSNAINILQQAERSHGIIFSMGTLESQLKSVEKDVASLSITQPKNRNPVYEPLLSDSPAATRRSIGSTFDFFSAQSRLSTSYSRNCKNNWVLANAGKDAVLQFFIFTFMVAASTRCMALGKFITWYSDANWGIVNLGRCHILHVILFHIFGYYAVLLLPKCISIDFSDPLEIRAWSFNVLYFMKGCISLVNKYIYRSIIAPKACS